MFHPLVSRAAKPGDAALPSSDKQLPAAPREGSEEEPAVSVAAGFIYLPNDLTDTPGGAGSYLLGWYGIPEYHINRHLSVIADLRTYTTTTRTKRRMCTALPVDLSLTCLFIA